jgi:hypothetical protein
VNSVVDAYPDINECLRSLSGAELAALCILLNCSDLLEKKQTIPVIERLLAKLIALSLEDAETDNQHRLVDEVVRLIDPDDLRAGLSLITDMSIDLLDGKEVEARKYLQPDGSWDFNFTVDRNQQTTPIYSEDHHYQIPGLPGNTILSSEQFRVPQTLYAQIDEHLHIQGYAGTGKSHLINVIIDLLISRGIKLKSILILALTWEQLQALMVKVPGSITGLTYNGLIDRVIPKGLLDKTCKRLRNRSKKTEQLLNEDIESVFCLAGIGKAPASSIAQASKEALRVYCDSDDDTVLSKHLPKWFKGQITMQKTKAESAALEDVAINTAKHLWQETLNPSRKDFQPPVRGYHQIKCAALHGLTIPKYYSHVIIDESHDLSQAMLQVLDNSLSTYITLGDDYQNLSGRPAYRSKKTREKNIVQSYRAGRQLDCIVNAIIEKHPVEPKELFIGGDNIKTTVDYYRKPTIPEKPAAILVSDYWAAWEWAQRLSKERIHFTLHGSLADLHVFVQDCIEFRANGTRPRHGKLFGYRSWDKLVEDLAYNRGFNGIHKLLQQGYTPEDWEVTWRWIQFSSSDGYALSMLENAKNREFDVVMLTPDTIDMIWKAENVGKDSMGFASAALYIGATRVRHRLIAPESLRNWIEEIMAKS